jgi:hypothetical protein
MNDQGFLFLYILFLILIQVFEWILLYFYCRRKGEVRQFYRNLITYLICVLAIVFFFLIMLALR